jgi:hypothetical protein
MPDLIWESGQGAKISVPTVLGVKTGYYLGLSYYIRERLCVAKDGHYLNNKDIKTLPSKNKTCSWGKPG